MEYKTAKIRLKDGRIATLRSPTVEDAAALLQYLKDTASETPFLLRSPEECTMTLAQEEAWLRGALSSSNQTMIVCEVDGEIAGNCQIERNNYIKTRHRATIGIALVKRYWGLGIGTAMFKEIIRLATQEGIEQLELEVFEGNDRAITLYKKMGFQIVAAKPNAIHLQDGRALKEFYMVRELSAQSKTSK